MKPKYEVQARIGIGPIRLGADRASAIASIGLEAESFMKTPKSVHPTDAFYEAGFQIFYEGEVPRVESIECSRDCGFEAILSGDSILDLAVPEALSRIEKVTGFKPETEDDGYTYEIPELGLWVWRQSNEQDEDGLYFSTIGVFKPHA